jgi:aspartokinase-like uncharacterized kinase
MKEHSRHSHCPRSMDEGERARRLVQKLTAQPDSGEFAQMIALQDEAIQLSAALAHIVLFIGTRFSNLYTSVHHKTLAA